jgi:hypothetical protein
MKHAELYGITNPFSFYGQGAEGLLNLSANVNV